MNILNVIGNLPKSAGTSVFCMGVCDELKAKGDDATIAVLEDVAREHYPSLNHVQIISMEEGMKEKTAGSSRYDLVHIHGLWHPSLHTVARWAVRNKYPVVWSPHGMLTPWALTHKWWKKMLGLLLYQYWDLRCARLLHATAESEVRDIRRLGFRQPIAVVPLGTRAPKFDGMPKAKGARDTRIVLFLSRVHPKKGLINLLQAWKTVLHASSEASAMLNTKWRLVIAGPDEGGHKAELIRLAETLRLSVADRSSDRHDGDLSDGAADVVFTGPVYDEVRDRLHRMADLFVLPSFSENFGAVVVDALAYGIPVITTVATPWQELVSHRCGWWVDIGVEPLARALQTAMAMSDGERWEMGVNGRRLVEDKYTWEAVAVRMRAVYAQVLAEHGELL